MTKKKLKTDQNIPKILKKNKVPLKHQTTKNAHEASELAQTPKTLKKNSKKKKPKPLKLPVFLRNL